MTVRTLAGAAVVGVAAAHVLPAATWLPGVRRTLFPSLTSPMRRGTVAITFDDGPHADGTPAILDALDDLRWTATFFVLGSAVRAHPDLARELLRRGHCVGVHGDEHRYLLARGPRAAYDDLHRAVDTVTDHLGVVPRWWRPPYGVLSGPGLVAARALKMRPLLWSAWGHDWKGDATPESIVRTVASGHLDGGTILLHDSDATSAPGSWRCTVKALPMLALEVAQRGLTVRPLP